MRYRVITKFMNSCLITPCLYKNKTRQIFGHFPRPGTLVINVSVPLVVKLSAIDNGC